MHVLIVGAGVTGLIAAIGFRRNGHEVSVYERKTREVFDTEGGAGIEIQSNAMKILEAWNIDISSVAHNNNSTQLRRYDTGEMVSEHLPPASGSKWWTLRSDYRRLLFSHAQGEGAVFHFNKNLQSVDETIPAITFSDNETVSADFVIGCDGVHSHMRQSMSPGTKAQPTVDCSFDIQIPFFRFNESQKKLFLDNEKAQLVMGPGKFLIMSVIPSRQVFEANFIDATYGFDQDLNKDTWVEELKLADSKKFLLKRFEDFWPPYLDLLNLTPSCWKWRFGESSCDSWISSNGKVVLAGDAVHAMVPHSAQGGSMCMEDAATLVELYRDGVPLDEQSAKRLAQAYQDIRKPRTSKVQKRARIYGQMWGVSDPAMQKKRDQALKFAETKRIRTKGNPNANLASIAFTVWLEDYDTLEEVSNTGDIVWSGNRLT